MMKMIRRETGVRCKDESDAAEGLLECLVNGSLVMMTNAKRFLKASDGAVTTDFVVLTAGIIGLALLFIIPVLAASVEWGEAIGTVAESSVEG